MRTGPVTVVLPTIDLTPIGDAIVNGDGATFARIANELGLELSLDEFLGYAKPFYPSHPDWLGRTFFQLAYAALHQNAGFETLVSLTMLVARTGDRLVLGIQRSVGRSQPFPKSGWTIGRWYKDPTRNRATVEAWASDPARERDALIIPIVRAPDIVNIDGVRRDIGEALLAAVVASPEDDAARLVYADWLAEQGDIRGELVRVQCELASPDLDPDRALALKERQHQILQSAGEGIRAAVESFAESAYISRGLIEGVEIRVVKLAKYGPSLVANHPICHLRILVNGPAELARLGTLPFLSRIPRLAIEARRTPRIMMSRVALKPSSLAKSPIFATTRELHLAYLDDDDAEWARFFRELEAPKLERLVLIHPGFSPRTLASLGPRPRAIEIDYPLFARLDAGAERREDIVEGVEALRGVAAFKFGSWHCGDAVLARCVRALLSSPKLVSLTIFNSTVDVATVTAICEHGERLERLSIYNNFVSLLLPLFSQPFPALRELELGGPSQLTAETIDEVIALLTAWRSPARVRWNTELTDEQRARLGPRLM